MLISELRILALMLCAAGCLGMVVRWSFDIPLGIALAVAFVAVVLQHGAGVVLIRRQQRRQ